MGSNVNNNLNGILDAMGIREEFEEKAKAAFEDAKASENDKSIFESKESFIEHYNDVIMGSKDTESIPVDYFTAVATDKGYIIDNSESANKLRSLVDRDGNGELSRDESSLLLDSAYEAATVLDTEPIEKEEKKEEKKENYTTVAIDPWGQGPDDCLSRIIANHVDGIKLYSEDYNQYLAKICELNGIEDPNVVYGEVKLPELVRDSNGEIQRDSDGAIKFAE